MEKSVKEIHKDRIKLYNSSIENHKKYIDPSTGLFAVEHVENRACPVCSSDKSETIFSKEGGTYVICSKCRMVYINPVFTDAALTDYYQNNHAVQSEIVENDQDFYVSLYSKGLDSIEKNIKNRSAILDIGCSSGVFLDLALKRGWKTNGVELNEKEAEYASKKQHTIHNKLLQDVVFDVKFDAITMWDVFEHIKDGAYYLNYMKNLLSDGGVIFLQVPSSDSLAAKMLREKCNMFDGLEHVNLYGVKSLELLCERCGLKILGLTTVIPEIGVMNNYLNYDDPYLGGTDNKTNIPNVIDDKKLLDNLQGYKIQAVIGVK